MPKSQQSWVGSRHPPTQWNLRGGEIKKYENNPLQCTLSKRLSDLFFIITFSVGGGKRIQANRLSLNALKRIGIDLNG
jgi:hypothetical protein